MIKCTSEDVACRYVSIIKELEDVNRSLESRCREALAYGDRVQAENTLKLLEANRSLVEEYSAALEGFMRATNRAHMKGG
ncbi:hypothetical protein BGZ54_009454, partial [Gamsiella multidivaricata]